MIETVDRNWWSKRESDWFNIEERLIFKNNKSNIIEGDSKVIKSWIKAINKQRDLIIAKEYEKQNIDRDPEENNYQLTFAYKLQ